jgi:hypothetical protein
MKPACTCSPSIIDPKCPVEAHRTLALAGVACTPAQADEASSLVGAEAAARILAPPALTAEELRRATRTVHRVRAMGNVRAGALVELTRFGVKEVRTPQVLDAEAEESVSDTVRAFAANVWPDGVPADADPPQVVSPETFAFITGQPAPRRAPPGEHHDGRGLFEKLGGDKRTVSVKLDSLDGITDADQPIEVTIGGRAVTIMPAQAEAEVVWGCQVAKPADVVPIHAARAPGEPEDECE